MDQRTEVFLITHEIFAIDKYCFPGIAGDNFFARPKWTEEMVNIFEEVGKLSIKNNIRFIKGEIREKESLTYIWVEAKKIKDIEYFYEEFETLLINSGHNYNFNTIKIVSNSCAEWYRLEAEKAQCENAVNEALDLIEVSKAAPA